MGSGLKLVDGPRGRRHPLGRVRLDLQENLRNLVHRLVHQKGHFDPASILRRLQPFKTRGRHWHGGVDLTT